jgi:hypothetical protein
MTHIGHKGGQYLDLPGLYIVFLFDLLSVVFSQALSYKISEFVDTIQGFWADGILY